MQPLNLGCNLQSGKHVLMFVPSAKHTGSPHGSTTILSRLLSHETKTALLSISTPTPTLAWTFVSLSSNLPPVELVFPKEPKYVSQLMARNTAFQCWLLKGLFAAATKAAAGTPRKHSFLRDPTKGASLRIILPAWTLLSAGREPSPRPLHISRVCSLGSALGKTTAFVLSDLPFSLCYVAKGGKFTGFYTVGDQK